MQLLMDKIHSVTWQAWMAFWIVKFQLFNVQDKYYIIIISIHNLNGKLYKDVDV